MEQNEISMLLDVKIDAKEKNLEMLSLRSWTNCLVKIEAIKCFPCYIKITFIKDYKNTDNADYVTRINLPGLHVQMASSRTKNFAYGLFWKNNRTRCTAFFGFEDKDICDGHMKWLKASITNLELHRQEILQLRRMSRHNVADDPSTMTDASHDTFLLYQNLHDTQDIKDMNDILGPLPNIPGSRDGSWERRISGMSGIYEEIKDFGNNSVDCRVSRSSIASGIYEEMKLVSNPDTLNTSLPSAVDKTPPSPPPLPPRSRLNTLESEIRRSFTNPETDSFKKVTKGRRVFEVVFGRSPSISSSKSETKNLPESKYAQVLRRNKIKGRYLGFDLLENKRNSFSSPDLTKYNNINENINIEENCSDNNHDSIDSSIDNSIDDIIFSNSIESSDSFNLYQNTSNGYISHIQKNLNISEQIQSNFNLSNINSSTANLIGSNVAIIDEGAVILRRKKSADESIPIPTITRNKTTSIKLNCNEIKENRTPPILPNGDKLECFDIQFKFEDSLSQDHRVYENVDKHESNHYVDMTRSKINLNSQSETNYDSPKSLKENNNSIKSNRNSIDDKIPSYYPNVYKTNIVSNKTTENLYIATPKLTKRKHSKQSSTSPQPTKTNIIIINNNSEPLSSKSKEVTSSNSQSSLNKQIDNISTTLVQHTSQPLTQRIYQKYATISRASNKYLEKCAKTTPTKIENVRKFASLPRFRKIDLSPLKIKINSVLQRHNSNF